MRRRAGTRLRGRPRRRPGVVPAGRRSSGRVPLTGRPAWLVWRDRPQRDPQGDRSALREPSSVTLRRSRIPTFRGDDPTPGADPARPRSMRTPARHHRPLRRSRGRTAGATAERPATPMAGARARHRRDAAARAGRRGGVDQGGCGSGHAGVRVRRYRAGVGRPRRASAVRRSPTWTESLCRSMATTSSSSTKQVSWPGGPRSSVIRWCHACRRRKVRTASFHCSGAWRCPQWPSPGSSTSTDPGIAVCSACATGVGARTSASP